MMCVQCGAESPSLANGLCSPCFAAKTPVVAVPLTLDVEVCAHCDARKVGQGWVDADEADTLETIRERAVRNSIRIHPLVREPVVKLAERARDSAQFVWTVHVEGRVEALPVSGDGELLVRVRRSVCDRCSRMFGGFYAGVLQLRATARDTRPDELERSHRIVGNELDRQRASGNREAFLTKSGAVPGGFDYYLGDIEGARNVARAVASKLGATMVETAKLVGRREGEDVYRVTFLVRVREYSVGDFAEVGEERLVQFISEARGRTTVRDLHTHGTDKLELEQLRRFGGRERIQQAVLISQDPRNVQLLDPVSLQTVEVPRPAGYAVPAGASSLPILRANERLYLVPQPEDYA